MATAVGVHTRIGADLIEARGQELAGALKDGLTRNLGSRVSFHTSPVEEVSSAVVIFQVEGMDAREAYGRLYEEHKIAGAGMGGGIRFSPHFYNTMEDMERAVEVVTAVAG